MSRSPLVSNHSRSKSLSNQRKLTRTEALNDESTASYVRHHFTQTFDTPEIIGAPNGSSTRTMGPVMAPTSELPVEIDLNEFMLDTDLDFVSRYFSSNQQY
ncbi:MAG: hypothetical protein EOO61_20580 [Hymenobacter sp.]|nr:MAG: hypothetical protein EOO61_20580 [Hymenobacter sp.]